MLRSNWQIGNNMGNNIKINKKINGFTLVEILVSTVIISIIGIFVVNIVLTIIRASIKAELMKEIKQNGDYAMDYLTRKIQFADSVQCAGGDLLVIRNEQDKQYQTAIYPEPIQNKYCALVYYNETFALSDLSNPIEHDAHSTKLTSDKITIDYGNNIMLCPIKLFLNCSSDSKSVDLSFTLKQRGNSPNVADQAQMIFKSRINVRNK